VIRGVIFDLDGTLFDGPYDWPAIKRELGLAPKDGTILEYFASLSPRERELKERTLRGIEERATRDGRLKPGAEDLLEFLRGKGLRLALVTNNHRRCADTILQRYRLRFDLVQTRESGLFKPSGAALLRAASGIELRPEEIVAVGDNELDNRAAHESGMGLVIIVNPETDRFAGRCDHALRDLIELKELFARLL
jgi:HAD superfamily hydrolase (TIGR01509 family)